MMSEAFEDPHLDWQRRRHEALQAILAAWRGGLTLDGEDEADRGPLGHFKREEARCHRLILETTPTTLLGAAVVLVVLVEGLRAGAATGPREQRALQAAGAVVRRRVEKSQEV